MIESILALLFVGAIIFVATTGERSDDKKPDQEKPSTQAKQSDQEKHPGSQGS